MLVENLKPTKQPTSLNLKYIKYAAIILRLICSEVYLQNTFGNTDLIGQRSTM